jgi:hypothetical protein
LEQDSTGFRAGSRLKWKLAANGGEPMEPGYSRI